MLTKANWIWRGEACADEYVQFYTDFEYTGGKCALTLCADSMFTVFLNGELAGFGKYPDYPHYRIADEIDLSALAVRGKNRLAILAYYIGTDFSTYYTGEAGLIFELEGEEGLLAASGPSTLCRLAPDYTQNFCKKITGQMGFSFRYDAEKADAWVRLQDKPAGFAPAKVIDLPKQFRPRPTKRLQLAPLIAGRIIQQGTFEEGDQPTAGERMLRAALSFVPPEEMFGGHRPYFELTAPIELCAAKKGAYIIVDLGREESGYLHLDFDVGEACEVEICYGEHLVDGRVRSYIDGRNFSFEYRAKKGANLFTDYFRRLGGRYLQIFFHTDRVLLRAAAVIPVFYPVERRRKKIENRLHRDIYDVSVRTLELCLHDHYEDTPWREQSFYTMDSRNQILFGYTAFRGTGHVRAGLRLFAEARRKDGLLMLCCPQGPNSDYPIPYFSLMYIIEVAEYVEYTGDASLAEEVFSAMRGVLDAIETRVRENGLIENFADPKIWDFYEWTDGMEGSMVGGVEGGAHIPSYDAPLSAFYLLAAEKFVWLCQKLGKSDGGTSARAAAVREACGQFYDEKKKLYKTFIGRPDHYSELTNSLLVLAGVAQGERAEAVLEQLVRKDNGMVAISASHSIFKYDALFTRGNKYADYILSEIEDRYMRMLRAGATSFWETDLGSEDFYRAGSLCHGWSSVPIYIFEKLGLCPDAAEEN